MAELAQRLGLDLPDPLTRDVEFPADFFQRSRSSVVQAEAKAQDLPAAKNIRKGITPWKESLEP